MPPISIGNDNFHKMAPFYWQGGEDNTYLDFNIKVNLDREYPVHDGDDWEIIKKKYKLES